MTTTITRTDDSATTTPALVLGYETKRSGRTVVHDLIGGGVAVTLVPPRPRDGTLELFYPLEVDAFAALDLLTAADTFTITDDDRPEVGMLFVATDTELRLDDETRDVWTVAVTYQEVTP